MKEKHKHVCNILIMAFTNLEKDVYSKTIPPPPHPSIPPSCKVEVILAPKIKIHLATAAFAIEYVYPTDRVTKRSVYRSP